MELGSRVAGCWSSISTELSSVNELAIWCLILKYRTAIAIIKMTRMTDGMSNRGNDHNWLSQLGHSTGSTVTHSISGILGQSIGGGRVIHSSQVGTGGHSSQVGTGGSVGHSTGGGHSSQVGTGGHSSQVGIGGSVGHSSQVGTGGHSSQLGHSTGGGNVGHSRTSGVGTCSSSSQS